MKKFKAKILTLFVVAFCLAAFASCDIIGSVGTVPENPDSSDNSEVNITFSGIDQSEGEKCVNYNSDSGKYLLSAPEKNGYTFDGWYKDNSLVTEISVEDAVSGSVIIEARWTVINFNITFNGVEGAVNDNPAIYNITNNTIVLSNPEKPGYVFDGWYNEAGEKLTEIPAGSVGDIVIDARWIVVNFNITFNGIEGADNKNPTTYNVTNNTIILNAPEKPGYTFDGWYNEAGEKIDQIPVGSVGDITIEAHWTIINFNITFNGVEGAENNNPATYTVINNTIILNNATKPGYTFDGWYNEAGEKVDTIPAGSVGDITIKAYWTVINFNITFNGVNGAVNPNPDIFTVEDIIYLEDLVSDNKHFEGWYSNGTKITKIDRGTVYDIDLVAKWSADLEINVFKAGTDYDLSNSTPISDVLITVTGNGVNNTQMSSVLGKYTFERLPLGEYTVKFTKAGYSDLTVSVTLDSNSSHNFYMDIDQSSKLTGVILEADADLNTSNNMYIANATVILTKFSGTNTLTLTATTDSYGKYTFDQLTAGIYLLSVSKDGYISAEIYVMVEERATTVQNMALEIIKRPADESVTTGNASGMIYDASLQGNVGVEGLTLTVKDGINNTNYGGIIATYTTGANGAYSIIDLPAGNYTVIITDERSGITDSNRFSTAYFNIKILPGKTISNQNGSVFPVALSGELRIVLTWGSSPSDLDSHITGPSSNGSTFHVYYSNKTNSYGNVMLDRDDTSAYGPETTTVGDPKDGVYHFRVHNFSGGSSGIENSGATVKVYLGGKLVYTFYAPSGSGVNWEVFEYNATTGEFTSLNYIH